MDVQNDKALDIALGNSRKTKTWKNKTVRWSELLDRLSAVTRTPETMAEYKAMTREQQSRIKDVGGFVGGYCNNGSRSDIRFRSILCLDADFADGDLWPDWELLYGSAAAIYSTHKHTTEKPRYRLVVPLSRSVDCDEYQAIGRRVAATLGIDKFDDTSYQPQRMMYWPSCSQDAPFVFRHTDGAFLDPDTVLATYHDWRDVSGWPMSSRVAEIVRKSAARQKDPLEKGGIVGAFCRAYSIQDAIAEFVPTYRACDDPGRYTYTEGSTAAGVVIYDDKFSFSHHGTDPASGQLCNAWDLVRLHRFGELDGECGADTPVSSRPSYRAMAQLASGDKRVKAQIVTDRMSEAAADFGESAEDGEDWKAQLRITEKGAIAQTIENAVIILQHDPQLAGRLALNEMEHSIVSLSSLPWRRVRGAGQWTDADDAALRYYLERTYGLTGKDRIFDAVNVVALQNKFHPVREYLDGCVWDGVPRIETLLVDYLGAEDTLYTRAVTRKALTAAACAASLLLAWFATPNAFLRGQKLEQLAQGRLAAAMPEGATLLQYSHLDDGLYLAAHTLPREKYFVLLNVQLEAMRDALDRAVREAVPDYVLVSWRELPAEFDRYELAASDVGYDDDNRLNKTLYLYRRKSE